MRLTMKERKPIYKVMAKRYQKASKKERSKLLDEFVDITAMNKSYAATLLKEARYHVKEYERFNNRQSFEKRKKETNRGT